jgi:hypothetical protein
MAKENTGYYGATLIILNEWDGSVLHNTFTIPLYNVTGYSVNWYPNISKDDLMAMSATAYQSHWTNAIDKIKNGLVPGTAIATIVPDPEPVFNDFYKYNTTACPLPDTPTTPTYTLLNMTSSISVKTASQGSTIYPAKQVSRVTFYRDNSGVPDYLNGNLGTIENYDNITATGSIYHTTNAQSPVNPIQVLKDYVIWVELRLGLDADYYMDTTFKPGPTTTGLNNGNIWQIWCLDITLVGGTLQRLYPRTNVTPQSNTVITHNANPQVSYLASYLIPESGILDSMRFYVSAYESVVAGGGYAIFIDSPS